MFNNGFVAGQWRSALAAKRRIMKKKDHYKIENIRDLLDRADSEIYSLRSKKDLSKADKVLLDIVHSLLIDIDDRLYNITK